MSRHERLTGWDNGNPYVRECFERTPELGGCEHMDTSRCVWCEHNLDTVRRLAQYEDCGLSPEQLGVLAGEVVRAMTGQKERLTQEQIDIVLSGELKTMLDKLADYESTGLSPGHVRMLAGTGMASSVG